MNQSKNTVKVGSRDVLSVESIMLCTDYTLARLLFKRTEWLL